MLTGKQHFLKKRKGGKNLEATKYYTNFLEEKEIPISMKKIINLYKEKKMIWLLINDICFFMSLLKFFFQGNIFWVNTLLSCNISDFRFIPKKNCLNFNPVIWRFFSFGLSWILTVHNRWYGKGVNQNSLKLQGAKICYFVIWCHEYPKPNNLQIIR